MSRARFLLLPLSLVALGTSVANAQQLGDTQVTVSSPASYSTLSLSSSVTVTWTGTWTQYPPTSVRIVEYAPNGSKAQLWTGYPGASGVQQTATVWLSQTLGTGTNMSIAVEYYYTTSPPPGTTTLVGTDSASNLTVNP